jgi:acetyl/propionyl-CoA carboxylase alpha subunit
MGFCRRMPLLGTTSQAGMVFVGPSPESISSFGLKHAAREFASKSGVPIVPGTEGLIKSEHEAVGEASKQGYPVRRSSTPGGSSEGLMEYRLC